MVVRDTKLYTVSGLDNDSTQTTGIRSSALQALPNDSASFCNHNGSINSLFFFDEIIYCDKV